MFSLNLRSSQCARNYAYQKSRSRNNWRVRRNTAKQAVKVNKNNEMACSA